MCAGGWAGGLPFKSPEPAPLILRVPHPSRLCNATTTNPLRFNYAPLQQLAFDLQKDHVANYNWITPDQYNEMHSSLNPTFAGLPSDESNIRSGDNTLSRLIPMIMASRAYKDGGLIIIWWDETEDDGAPGDNQDDFNHTLGEVIISRLARDNRMAFPTPTRSTTPTPPICALCRKSST